MRGPSERPEDKFRSDNSNDSELVPVDTDTLTFGDDGGEEDDEARAELLAVDADIGR